MEGGVWVGFVGCGGSVIFGGSLGAVGRCVGAAADGAPLVGGVVIAVEADASVVAVVTADSSAGLLPDDGRVSPAASTVGAVETAPAVPSPEPK